MEETTKSYCNKCIGQRNHELLHKEESPWSEEIHEGHYINGNEIYEMLKCRGCDQISVRHNSLFSEAVDENGNQIESTKYYPPAIFRSKPRWHSSSWEVFGLFNESRIIKLLDEVYVAMQNDLSSLAAMGIRALIEHIMIEKVGDHRSFEANLKKFQEGGFISELQITSLKQLIEAGHAAMHRGYTPTQDELSPLIDITESIIESIYFNEHRAKRIEKNTPKRSRPAATGPR